jgi:hypothetical protein
MTANPFSRDQAGPLPGNLKQLDRPMHEVLGKFIHGCSSNPATRTAATAALVLSLWQLRGKALTPQIPSMLLLRPEGTGPDPIDKFVRMLIDDEKNNEPRVQKEGLFMQRPIDHAPKAMANAVVTRRSLGQNIRPGDLGRRLEAQTAEETFRAARVTAHGHGRSRRYRNAWHPDYGLLTDADDQLVLRLNEDEDRSAFCRDLLEEPVKLVSPWGIGAHLFPTAKTISISGALTTDLWSRKHAGMGLASGLPLFVLPHFADAPLKETGLNALRCFAMIWQNARLLPVETDLRLPGSDWVRRYHLALRERLAVSPLPAMFPILQAIHQLEEICRRIVGAASGPGTTEEAAHSLHHDLYHHTLRGLVIGVASHRWFGVGLMPGEKSDEMRKKAGQLLARLRSEGPVTMTDLLKNFHLKKHERDALLEALSGQGLLQVDGSTVAATSYRDFVEGLYASEEFPAVESAMDRRPDAAAAKARKVG